jgi:hypothetical protein
VVPVTPWRIAAAVSGWLLAVTVVSCLAWLAITSAGHRVGLATTAEQPVAGRSADVPGSVDAAAPTGLDRVRQAGNAGAAADGDPSAQHAPAPVTAGPGGRPDGSQGGSAGGPGRTGTNGTGPSGAAGSAAPGGDPQVGGSFPGAPVPAGAAGPAAPEGPTTAPSGGLPTVTSRQGRVPPARTAPAPRTTRSGTDASSAAATSGGRSTGTFSVAGGELLLTCSASGVADWRVLASIGWATTGGLRSPGSLLVTFSRDSLQSLVRGDCIAGVPVFSASGPAGQQPATPTTTATTTTSSAPTAPVVPQTAAQVITPATTPATSTPTTS